tara:strand:+ start:1738 stop:2382 length:645 start_codon:yes stop_codon:yes gene_type:complete
MILFLDTISSLPEFCLIEDKKIVYSKKILPNQNDKMSDLLIPSYLELEKDFNLNSKLKLLITNTGPGSYTALRIGIAFFASLSLSKNISLIGISCIDLFRFIIPDEELYTSGIMISSSNDQNFICIFNKNKNRFIINKIEKNLTLPKQDIYLSMLKKVYTNENLNEENKGIFLDKKINVLTFSEIVNMKIEKIENLKKNDIIKPIYYSNNKILN